MTELTEALDELMAQHRRIGSPVPGYLRPGLPADDVRRRIVATLGLDPPADVIDPFAWHDGIDEEAWRRDGAGTGFARLFGDAYLAPLADAIRHYRERIETDETTARYSMPGEALQTWKPSWFPVFSEGWETYGVECDPGSPNRGLVYDPSWDPPAGVGPGPRFRNLQHLLESVVRRFQAGGYEWNAETRFLDELREILEPLYEREIAEARA
jgi:cell wall assembly regulator SMI1